MKSPAGPRGQDAVAGAGASWASPSLKSKPADRIHVGRPRTDPPKPKKSFSAIQQEEESKRDCEDNMCRLDGNRWYVTQRERAASIGQIQEQERREREMAELVEEQRGIEEEIRRRLRREEEGDGDDGRKKNGRRRRQGKGGVKGAGQKQQGHRQKGERPNSTRSKSKKSAEVNKDDAR